VILAVLSVSGVAGCQDTSTAAGPTTTTHAAESLTPAPDRAYRPGQRDVTFDVGGLARTAVLVVPANLTGPLPLVFVFHGHGGQGRGIQRTIDLESHWPETVVVYPDGLPGHRGITDPEGVKPGWQSELGEAGDRDLEFFDVILTALQSSLPVDAERIYVMGHSNGSQFASLVLNQRGEAIAAAANVAAAPNAQRIESDPVRSRFVAMGMDDPLVPFELQQRAIPRLEAKLAVDTATATVDGYLRSEAGPNNIELALYVHPGGHAVPPEVPPLVADFFRRHTLSGG